MLGFVFLFRKFIGVENIENEEWVRQGGKNVEWKIGGRPCGLLNVYLPILWIFDGLCCLPLSVHPSPRPHPRWDTSPQLFIHIRNFIIQDVRAQTWFYFSPFPSVLITVTYPLALTYPHRFISPKLYNIFFLINFSNISNK
jgi:hypothetical protein